MAATVFNGVFNVTEGLTAPWNVPGLYADGTHAGDNTTNLNAMIQWLLDSSGPTLGNGGTLEFPSAGTYAFNGTITISTDRSNNKQPATIMFKGDGQGQLGVPILQQQSSVDLFLVNNNTGSSQDIGGTVFEDLMLSYTSSASGTIAGVHVTGGSNSVRLSRVTLVNCPIGYWLEDSQTCRMINCTVYNANNAGIPLYLGNSGSQTLAIETYIAGCLFLCYGRTDGTAVQIYGCEHLRMTNMRLEGWGQGIAITPASGTGSPRKLYFANVSCYPNNGAAVLIQVAGGKYATQVWFEACEFNPSGGSISTYTDAGIVIDQGSGSGDVVDQIRLVDCYSVLWAGPGMKIKGGSNIEVLGGHYSCNGTNTSPASADLRSGIDIAGAASGVRITGAACNNSVFDIYLSPPGPAPSTQQYGIYVSHGATSVRIHSCDLTGNGTNGAVVDGSSSSPTNVFIKHCDFTGISTPVQVTTPVSNLQVSECPGYNDRGITLSSSAPPNGLIFQSTYFNYYGPIAFYMSGGTATSVTIDGNATGLPSGAFTLGPGESAAVFYSLTRPAPTFYAVGK